MKIFCLVVALCLPFLEVSAQPPSSNPGNTGKPQARLINSSNTETSTQAEARKDYPATQLIEELRLSKQVPRNITVKGILNIVDFPDLELQFTDVVFDDDVNISGQVKSIKFDQCQFKQNVDFYEVESNSLRIANCEFAGSVWFDIKVKNFELRKCGFEKTVYFGNTDLQQTSLAITSLSSREPIRINWSQFGERWLKEMKIAGIMLGGGDEKHALRRNSVDVLRELEFWKNNFNELGHKRDADRVNYEINLFTTKDVGLNQTYGQRLEAMLMSLPNGFGTAPYRPLKVGLFIIVLFALIYRVADPFILDEEVKNPKPKRPLSLFSLMYSVDTFIPVIDVTKVRDWGWQVSPAYRWVTVTERLLGLLVFYSATYSLAYYVF